MYLIKSKKVLSEGVKEFIIEAPVIARKRKAGQFVVVRIGEDGERIPLTIVDSNPNEGTIQLIVQEVGKTTYEMMNHGMKQLEGIEAKVIGTVINGVDEKKSGYYYYHYNKEYYQYYASDDQT